MEPQRFAAAELPALHHLLHSLYIDSTPAAAGLFQPGRTGGQVETDGGQAQPHEGDEAPLPGMPIGNM